MNESLRNYLKLTLRFGLAAILIGWLLSRIPPTTWAHLREQGIDWPYLVLAFFFALGAILIAFFRWWLLIRCVQIPLSLREAFRLGLISHFLGYVSVGNAGSDLFRGIFLAHRSPGQRIEAAGTIVLDRLLGLVGLLLVAAFGMSVAAPESTDRFINGTKIVVYWGTAISLLTMAGLMYGGRLTFRLPILMARVPWAGTTLSRLSHLLLVFARHRRIMFVSVLISIATNILQSLSVAMVAESLFVQVPSISEHLLMVPLATAATALPLTPAGLGVFEATLDHLYRTLTSYPDLSGTLVGLGYNALRLLPGIFGAVLLARSDGFRKVRVEPTAG